MSGLRGSDTRGKTTEKLGLATREGRASTGTRAVRGSDARCAHGGNARASVEWLVVALGEGKSSHGDGNRAPTSPRPTRHRPGVPTVDLQASQNVSSVKRSIRLVLPTPREPMMMT